MLISSVMLDVLSADVYMMAYSVGGVLVGNERALQLDPRDKRTAQRAQEAGGECTEGGEKKVDTYKERICS